MSFMCENNPVKLITDRQKNKLIEAMNPDTQSTKWWAIACSTNLYRVPQPLTYCDRSQHQYLH